MPHRTDIADALRRAGLTVQEVEGWRSRGSATFNPRGVICHHTAGPAHGDMPSLGILVNGRTGLPGPLCQVGLARSGVCHVIAAGRANHAGKGEWQGLSGNRSVFGIEAESTGRGDWTDAQRRVYPVLARALADLCGAPVANICGHKEWTGRKIDPAGIDMNELRRAAEHIPPSWEEEHLVHFVKFNGHAHVFMVLADHLELIPSEGHLNYIKGSRPIEQADLATSGLQFLPVRTRRDDGVLVDVPLAQVLGA